MPIEDIEEIAVEHFYIVKSEDGTDMIMARGLDGVLYRIVCKNSMFIPITLTDAFSHEPQNRRRLHRTCSNKL